MTQTSMFATETDIMMLQSVCEQSHQLSRGRHSRAIRKYSSRVGSRK